MIDKHNNFLSPITKESIAQKNNFFTFIYKLLPMKDEITLLREENKRLNTIINALSEKLVVVETLICAYEKNNIGTPNVINAMLENNIGTPNLSSAMPENNMGTSNVSNAMLKNNMGTPNLSNAMPENSMGAPNVRYATLTNKVGTSPINIEVLMNELKAVMKYCGAPSLNNTAKVLIHLYDNPKNALKELRKVTGLALDGMAKHIRAMQKRNLITKISFQQYALSSMAIEMLENSRQ